MERSGYSSEEIRLLDEKISKTEKNLSDKLKKESEMMRITGELNIGEIENLKNEVGQIKSTQAELSKNLTENQNIAKELEIKTNGAGKLAKEAISMVSGLESRMDKNLGKLRKDMEESKKKMESTYEKVEKEIKAEVQEMKSTYEKDKKESKLKFKKWNQKWKSSIQMNLK